MKINEELIAKGRQYKRLLENEDFAVLLDELNGDISFNQHMALECLPSVEKEQGYKFRRKALIDFRSSIYDTIEAGGKELLRKENLRQLETARNSNQPSKATGEINE